MKSSSPTDAPPEKGKAGRPLGAVSKLAKDSIEKAKSTGLLPHEILLSMARGEPQVTYVCNDKGTVTGQSWECPDLPMRADCAKAAAPYYAPKITAVEVISGMPDDELDSIIAKLAAETGVDLGADREGAAGEEAQQPAQPRRRARPDA